jgi:hypothetical protein
LNESGPKLNLGFLFVTGCARSGTTEIVNVLNRHPAVAIGMERFKFVIRDRIEEFQQCLFAPDNFVRAAEEDTNILPRSPAYRDHYANLKSKFDAGRVQVVGDKLPFLFRHYEAIEKRFNSPRWIRTVAGHGTPKTRHGPRNATTRWLFGTGSSRIDRCNRW